MMRYWKQSVDFVVHGSSWIAAHILIWLLAGYKRFLSPFLGDRCRFYPYCSDYSREAIQVHGVCKGLILTAVRLFRCQPWFDGGIDPVPDAGCWRAPKKPR